MLTLADVDEITSFFQTAIRHGVGHAVGQTTLAAQHALGQQLTVHPMVGVPEHLMIDEARVRARLIVAGMNAENVVDVAVRLAEERLKGGQPLPPTLADYAVARLKGEEPRRQPGPTAGANDNRDVALAMTVQMLVDRGFNETRNKTSENQSACSLAADMANALGQNLSEDAVYKIVARVRTLGRLDMSE